MSKKILLVDDDSDDIALFIEALKEVDPSVTYHYAFNGEEALNLLREISALPDVILLDINMPILNGWESLTRLKADNKLKHIQVIMYSTSSHQRDLIKAFELGACCFFVKPYEFKELKNALAAILNNLDNDLVKSLQALGIKNLLCPDQIAKEI